jgi:6-phosphogluconolactonase/glucosamine-6-phosphate isomerase/deaminase
LVVRGAKKRAILAATLRGAPTPEVPASLLQTHAAVTVLADREAWPGGASP